MKTKIKDDDSNFPNEENDTRSTQITECGDCEEFRYWDSLRVAVFYDADYYAQEWEHRNKSDGHDELRHHATKLARDCMAEFKKTIADSTATLIDFLDRVERVRKSGGDELDIYAALTASHYWLPFSPQNMSCEELLAAIPSRNSQEKRISVSIDFFEFHVTVWWNFKYEGLLVDGMAKPFDNTFRRCLNGVFDNSIFCEYINNGHEPQKRQNERIKAHVQKVQRFHAIRRLPPKSETDKRPKTGKGECDAILEEIMNCPELIHNNGEIIKTTDDNGNPIGYTKPETFRKALDRLKEDEIEIARNSPMDVAEWWCNRRRLQRSDSR